MQIPIESYLILILTKEPFVFFDLGDSFQKRIMEKYSQILNVCQYVFIILNCLVEIVRL